MTGRSPPGIDFPPSGGDAGLMRKVAVLVEDGAEPFGLGAMCEVWAEPHHPEDDNPVFDFVVATPVPGRVAAPSGFDLHVEHGLDAAADADLVCIAPKRRLPQPLAGGGRAVRAAHDRGAWSSPTAPRRSPRRGRACSAAAGAPPTGATSTSWPRATRGGRRPRRALRPGRHDRHRRRLGGRPGRRAARDAPAVRRQVAAAAARRMVVPPHRDGGQAQFIERVVTDCAAETLGPLLTWILENLADDLSVEQLAKRAHMSTRTFARRFRDETGSTPHSWVTPSGSWPPRSCSRAPTTPSTGSPARSASATPPPCGTTSAGPAGSARSSTAVPSPATIVRLS